jgi:hypothetical protein
MGYTHYWRGQRAFTDSEWTAICADAAKLLTDPPVRLALEYDQPTAAPVVDVDFIQFNGPGELGYETFLLEREPAPFQFCKTAHYPYDVVVTAILACAAHHAPEAIQVSSDGDADDWSLGLQLLRDRCGGNYENPIRD